MLCWTKSVIKVFASFYEFLKISFLVGWRNILKHQIENLHVGYSIKDHGQDVYDILDLNRFVLLIVNFKKT